MATTEKHDVVDLLVQQHEHIRELFRSVEEAAGHGARQQRFEELRRFLAVHETAEELITHPRVRLAEGGNAVVDARLEEETEAKKMLADLDGMKVEEPTFDTKLAALKVAVLAHARAEEQEEFPLLRKDSDARQLERMAAAVLAAEAIAPTHPHPSVGSSMTTNLMAGPLASVLDRTRDAVRAALESTTSVPRSQHQGWAGVIESLTNNVLEFTKSASPVGNVDPRTAIDQVFDFWAKMLAAQREALKQLANAAAEAGGRIQSQAAQVGSVVREQGESTTQVAREHSESTVQAAREQSESVNRAESDEVVTRYEGLNKAQLQEELASRALPKTGNVAELRERLIADDLK